MTIELFSLKHLVYWKQRILNCWLVIKVREFQFFNNKWYWIGTCKTLAKDPCDGAHNILLCVKLVVVLRNVSVLKLKSLDGFS
jgi:hypothetical protein